MTPALLLIDVQRNMLLPPEPIPDASAVRAALTELLARARRAGSVIVHVRNSGDPEVGDPDVPGTPGWELVFEPLPEEHVIDKLSSDSFDGTGLERLLPAKSPLVVAGMQSEYCVRATSLAAISRGHAVVLASGAHATYPDAFPDGQPAEEISAAVELELAAAGAEITPWDGIRF
ncbi:isochorismatase family protein [Streptacidiphilus carbonis]|uniref:isochorismatase family protein n=1 Tax=Streptacidiphilus carbonis TaxID=105422 RepID=UPI0005A85C78|nr:isochorismatase family protein [Streptacidiphilus carbonis]